MNPYSVAFHTNEHFIFKIIYIVLALFVVGTWIHNSAHIKLILRILGVAIGGFISYFVTMFFFAILQFSYTTVKDNFNPNKQSAVIIKYEKHVSRTSSRNSRSIGSHTRRNTFYRPFLEYKDSHGSAKRAYGDVSFSINNQKAVGDKIEVIVENNEVRIITPIKNFNFVINIVMLCFLLIIYYTLYNYAKTQSFENVGTFAITVLVFVIFPLAFCILIYLFLNIGYDYFFLNKRYTGKNSAIFLSGLGIFLALCLLGYFRMLIENIFFKKQKKSRKKKKVI